MLSPLVHQIGKVEGVSAPMQPIDLADTLNRFQWDALRALCAPSAEAPRPSGAAIQELLKEDLLELHDDQPALTAKGRRVLVCGSPRLWNS